MKDLDENFIQESKKYYEYQLFRWIVISTLKISSLRLTGESSLSLKAWEEKGGEGSCSEGFLVGEDALFLVSDLEALSKIPQEDFLLTFSIEDMASLIGFLEKGILERLKPYCHCLLVGVEEKDLSLILECDSVLSKFLRQLSSFFYTSLSPMYFFSGWHRLWLNIRTSSVVIHGTLMNVFGVGVLLVGDSGIGKSEAAYGLVRRGHSLICDDAVRVMHSNFFNGKLLGFPDEPALQGFMEVKGVGIVNVISMHGVAILQDYSRIDMVIELQEEKPCKPFGFYNVLEQAIPKIFLEIKGHQDWISLLESVILNNKLKLLFAYDSLAECEAMQRKIIRRKTEGL